jgi:hypothetical protein
MAATLSHGNRVYTQAELPRFLARVQREESKLKREAVGGMFLAARKGAYKAGKGLYDPDRDLLWLSTSHFVHGLSGGGIYADIGVDPSLTLPWPQLEFEWWGAIVVKTSSRISENEANERAAVACLVQHKAGRFFWRQTEHVNAELSAPTPADVFGLRAVGRGMWIDQLLDMPSGRLVHRANGLLNDHSLRLLINHWLKRPEYAQQAPP